jgi:alpha-beta hydrolase superfamily lysophospholipase/1-acyl-sn-glycerol-3-phosphate acyltransferase
MQSARIITDPGQGRGSGGGSGLRPGPSNDPPTTRLTRAVRRTTGIAMQALERVIGARLQLTGIDNIGEGPVFFVANHFTRFETFIVPYLIWLHTGRMVRSLAWHGLFHGVFGRYLLTMGARPTRDPGIRHRMVEDLMTGAHDWLIYPEGGMVKDKRLWQAGRYELAIPDRKGPPHSGAAVIALKALAYRALYLQALRDGDQAACRELAERYHLAGPGAIAAKPVRIVPVSITYYPLRPESNLLSRIAERLSRSLPDAMREELLVEGSLLLHRTDMSVHIGRPLEIARYADLIVPAVRTAEGLGARLRAVSESIDGLRHRLTRRMMHEVYGGIDVTFDHLFCAALRHLRRDTVPVMHLRRAIWLAARQLAACGEVRLHATLGADLDALPAGGANRELASALRLAAQEGILTEVDGCYRINRVALASDPGFHGIRLRNTVAVIANEIEPVRPAVRAIARLANLPVRILERQCARWLARVAAAELRAEREGGATIAEGPATPAVLAAPRARLAAVLVHGFAAAPGEMMPLAQHLRAAGHAVVVVRLPGHGTRPERLAATGAEDWSAAVARAVALARCLAPRVALVGFSAGGLLALRAAAELPEGMVAVAAVNPALAVRDRRLALVRPMVAWNRFAARWLPALPRLESVPNRPDWSDTNYDRHPLAAVAGLQRLARDLRRSPPHPACPALLLQSDRDDVVDPDGAERLARLIGGAVEVARIAGQQHVSVRGAGAEAVWRRIGGFLDDALARCG